MPQATTLPPVHHHYAVGVLYVLNLWATTSVVRLAITLSSARCMRCSDSLSSADVASSRNQNRGVLEYRPGNGNALALTAAQPAAIIAQQGVNTLRQTSQ